MNHEITNANHATRAELRRQTRVVRRDVSRLGRLGKKAARTEATAYYRRGKEKVQAVGENVTGYVKENPIKSVLIATAAGAILGAIWSRRR